MQVVHLLIATASVTLVALRAPFTWLQKALLAAGYFTVFEYGVISRNYALGVLLLALRLGDAFVQLRKEVFKEQFPASALITAI